MERWQVISSRFFELVNNEFTYSNQNPDVEVNIDIFSKKL